MAHANPVTQVFNRGRLSVLGLARTDLERTRLSAEIQTNFMPRTLGSMMLRPGLGHIGSMRNSSTAILIPFVKDVKDTALLEFTSTAMRVRVADALVTRAPSTAAIVLGTFSSTLLGGWTDIDDAGATSGHFGSTRVVAGSSDFMSLVGTRFARAGRRQTVTSSAGTHGLNVVIARGRVNLRVGSTAGGSDYYAERTLNPGAYSLGIVSTGDFTIDLTANSEYRSLVQSLAIESSGAMVVDSTWVSSDLHLVRNVQSADVIFAAANGYQQKRIERYSTESWGIVQYEPQDGPFRGINVTNIRLAASGLTGNVTLEADQPLFVSNHRGALFRLTSQGQEVSITVSASDQFSSPIRVTGVGDSRLFDILITAASTYDATILVQRSIGDSDNFSNVTGLSFTATNSTDHADGLDNQIVFYRIGSGAYVSGSPVSTLSYDAGGLSGIVRIDDVISSTESSASVLSNLGSTAQTELWEEGDWSTLRGFPSAVNFHEGRLWWAGKAKVWGTVSDAFDSFDQEVLGDAGPVNRSIASGAVDQIQWIGSVGTMVLGAESRELQAKTDSLEQPLTPTNFNLRDVSDQGSAGVQAVKVDQSLIFVQKSGLRVYELGYGADSLTYVTRDISTLVPEIGEPGLTRMAVQRQPDTRIHAVRSSTDGTAAVLLSDKAENVLAWIDIETGDADGFNGRIEEVAVLPSTNEDAIYYTVRREINGSTQLFLEKWAQEREAQCLPIKAHTQLCVSCADASTSDFISSITVDGVEILGRPVYCPPTGGGGQGGDVEFAQEIADVIVNNGYDLATGYRSTSKFLYTGDDFTFGESIKFKSDGKKMYVEAGSVLTGQIVHQYNLSTPWDLRTAVYDSANQFVLQEATARGIGDFAWKSNGAKFYALEGTLGSITSYKIYQYSVDVPWELGSVNSSSAEKISPNFLLPDSSAGFFYVDTTGTGVQPEHLQFRNDGNRLYLSSVARNRLYQFSLTDEWEIDTAVFEGKMLDMVSLDGSTDFEPINFEIHPSGKSLFVTGNSTDQTFFRYTLGESWEIDTASTNIGVDILGNVGLNHENGFKWTFQPNGCALFWNEGLVVKGIHQIDLACGTLTPPSSGDAIAAGSQSSAPFVDRSSRLANGNCITIEAEAIGTCASEQVIVTVQGNIETILTSAFLGGQALCGERLNKLADSFECQESTATNFITGADHLAGETVIAWGAGQDLGSYVVSSTGTFTVPVASTAFCYGLPYDAWFKSVKLAYAAEAGTALTQRKKVNHLGFVLYCTHARGLEYGPSTDILKPMPEIEEGKPVSPNAIWPTYDQPTIHLPGEWDTDSRVVLKARAPLPATVLAAVIQMETKEKV